MMKNQETASVLIEMEENIGCGIIFDFAGNYGKRNGGIFVVVLIITAVVLILGKLK